MNGGGGIRNSESLTIGENSRFCSVLSDGGSEILSPSEFGVNSRFCSVLSDGGSKILSPFEFGFVQF